MTTGIKSKSKPKRSGPLAFPQLRANAKSAAGMRSVGVFFAPSALRSSNRQYRTLPSPPTPTLRPVSWPLVAQANADSASANEAVKIRSSCLSSAYASMFWRSTSGSGSSYVRASFAFFRSFPHAFQSLDSSSKYSSISSVTCKPFMSAGSSSDRCGFSSVSAPSTLAKADFLPETLHMARAAPGGDRPHPKYRSPPVSRPRTGHALNWKKRCPGVTWPSGAERPARATAMPAEGLAATAPLALPPCNPVSCAPSPRDGTPTTRNGLA
mmetsp:Transcript_87366/g.152065  ORF Transcript_87366/g.152065 Transcript_87366/m.152065 type:complete len:268 (-) Transcript_87366:272-1075(-)